MLYALTGTDQPGTLATRMAVRDAHLARLKALLDAGRLVLAGPLPAVDSPDPGPAGFTGSLVVAEFASLAEAQAWLAADPYVEHGVFAETRVQPFKKVFP
ncbi:YciI family protein [Niveibacterium terrae]|uniref:YciI family protein n=1 Tax=Niveibacterium terrae TaxID=3373598 RepID=UPI003A95B395